MRLRHFQTDNCQPRSIENYFKEIDKFDLLDPEEEIELTHKARKGDLQAFDKLIEANLRFVISVAKQYHDIGLPFEDLICEGNLGLIEAAKRFDEKRGFKFISYAVWWIRQSILRAMSEKSRMIRFPANQLVAIRRVSKVFAKLQGQYGEKPKLSEIADYMNLTESEVSDILENMSQHQSLNTCQRGDSSGLLDVLEDMQAKLPDATLIQESLKDEIDRILNTLKPMEALVIRLYFGLSGKRRSNLAEIGEHLNLSRERVRQIKKDAINRLRLSSRSELLRKYLG